MALTEIVGTPSELRARILDSLLTGSRRVSGSQPVSRDLVVKDLFLPFLTALGLAGPGNQLKVSAQSQAPLASWWDHHKDTCIAIRHSANETDENPNYVMLTCALVSNLLALSLGGAPDFTRTNRPPTRVELKFAERLGLALSNAINPLLRGKTHFCSALDGSANATLEAIAGQSMHVIDLDLTWDGHDYPLSIALSETKIERRAAEKAKPVVNREASASVSTEIGKTSVCVDVIVKIADQTLDRLQNLKTGEVLPMAANSLSEARIEVRGHEIYTGQIGRSGKNFGFKVLQPAQNKVSGLTNMVNALTSEGERS